MKLRPTLLAAAFLTLTACEAETTPTHVACIGDSITAGDGASSSQQTYPADLQRMLGPKVVVKGFGHNGATLMGAGAGDLPYDVQAEYAEATRFVGEAGPDAHVAVILLLGTNDSKPAVWDGPTRKERFVADYAKLIDHFAALPTSPTVYLATPIGTGQNPCCGIRGEVLTHDIIPAIQELARTRSLALVDLTTLIAGHPELLTDGVHPADKGYEALAGKVRDVLAAHPPKRGFWSRISR